MFSSRQIANYFIQKNFDTGLGLTPMKLLKLCYIAHGWHLGYAGTALLPEGIQAWKYGPVIISVYHDFKHYGKEEITSLITDCDFDDEPNYVMPQDPWVLSLLNTIWQVYGKYDGIFLSSLTHEDGTPWDIVWNKQGGNKRKSAIIPNDLIRDYYKQKITETNARAN